MKYYNTPRDLRDACAIAQHKRNLEDGGVFVDGPDGPIRYSDLELERKVASKEGYFLSKAYAPAIMPGLCRSYGSSYESNGRSCDLLVIDGVGFAPYWSKQ